MNDVTPAAIRLVLADDHPIVRDGLRGICESAAEFDVVGEASNGIDAASLALRLEPDVVLMDLRMPAGDGVDAIRQLVASGCRSHVLVLTTYDTDHDVMAAIDAGATGYLLKDAPAKTCSRQSARPPEVRRCFHRRSPLAWSPGLPLAVPMRSVAERPMSLRWSPRDVQMCKSRVHCSSARPPSRPIWARFTVSSACMSVPPRLPPHTSAATSAPNARGYLGS